MRHRSPPSNARVADLLEEVASLLERREANPFRVRAWREGAAALRRLKRPASRILAEQGRQGLVDLPHIGRGLAAAVDEIVQTGRLGALDRMRAEATPEDVFETVPGIGHALAERIHAALGIDTLEALEQAAYDGRLEAVPGIGARRARAVRDVLAGRLSRRARRRVLAASAAAPHTAPPPIPMLLRLDEDYRAAAAKGRLKRIAPKRMNPEGRAWLPILHDRRGGYDLTVMFSNTARAHELGKTHEWVVVFYEKAGVEDQCTVVTETRGVLAGRRVVRGREAECRAYYRKHGAAARSP